VNTFQRLAQAKVRYYRVKRGDNLSTIAQKYDVAVDDLKKWNNIKGNKVAYGKNLKINGVEAEEKSSAIAKVEIDKKGIQKDSLASSTASFYVVQKGDNLSNIAKKFNVTVADIQDWNKLTTKNLPLGMALQVVKNPTNKEEVAIVTPERKDIQYMVQKGDNLSNIAKKFGATLEDLKQWNNLTSNAIALGSSIIVAKNEIAIVTNKASVASFKKKDDYSNPTSKEVEYYVKKGDSLYSISKKYPGVTIADLKKWNNIKSEELKPGMKLKING
jgi:membrane-bound lytic murein transglycosylase D